MSLELNNLVHREPGDDRDPGKALLFWCPGCETHHRVVVAPAEDYPSPVWEWNGSLDAATISPSILVNRNATKEDVARGAHRCHSFLRNGVLDFLSDCTHALAGQKVKAEPPC